ncbi:carnosine N-methyltransferase isoform X2 [Phlebotomus papatasi]|uniref:carnosine N-methyltransferase isoform X2 n=1 Tax=Phlebotomus papatasi TaxID=29031 RepID=UPI0024834193|nr:carnosine N-methyltransferase isoform X2 [Phlebotomus papatasi]
MASPSDSGDLLNHDESVDMDSTAAQERQNFESVIAAFLNYKVSSLQKINATEAYFSRLPSHHQEMLKKYTGTFKKIRDCIDQNFNIIRLLLMHVNSIFDEEQQQPDKAVISHNYPEARLQFNEIEGVEITLKLFARDWSLEGAEEREQCYSPIIDAITEAFNPEECDVSRVRVLVPGAGLGRLAYELAYRGYFCEGNEFSYFMLIASNFILNKCLYADQHTLYPWIHQYVNNVKREDQIRPITFPDVSPIQAPPSGKFNMVAGDFLQVYNDWDAWDCVATCFFIDCANNVVEFVERIYRILRPEGIWVNLGPLLYHYSDILNEGSIEPTYEDLQSVIETVGFKFLRNETGVRTKYSQNPRSMQQSEYLSVFFVCQKPKEATTSDDGELDGIE